MGVFAYPGGVDFPANCTILKKILRVV